MPPFQVYLIVAQGDPLSPTIFNMVVDSVIQHRVTVVAATEAGAEVLGVSIQDIVEYFYADDGLVTSTQLERLHRLFEVLADLFEWVGLRTNTWNMLSMAFQQYHTPGIMLVVAYERLTTGKGPTYWGQKRIWAQCLECGLEFATGLIMTHCQSQHYMVRGYQGGYPSPPQLALDLLALIPQQSVTTPVPSRRVSWGGVKPDQPLGSLFALPRAGQNFDPGGGEPTLPQMRHVCTIAGPQNTAPLDRPLTLGRVAKESPTGGGGCEGGGINCTCQWA